MSSPCQVDAILDALVAHHEELSPEGSDDEAGLASAGLAGAAAEGDREDEVPAAPPPPDPLVELRRGGLLQPSRPAGRFDSSHRARAEGDVQSPRRLRLLGVQASRLSRAWVRPEGVAPGDGQRRATNCSPACCECLPLEGGVRDATAEAPWCVDIHGPTGLEEWPLIASVAKHRLPLLAIVAVLPYVA